MATNSLRATRTLASHRVDAQITSIQGLRQYVNNRFNQVADAATLDSPAFLQCAFDSSRSERFKSREEMHKAYNGYGMCGPASYVMSPYLRHDFPHLRQELGHTRVGYGRHGENHTYLILRPEVGCDNYIIIDPTYKQFFINGALYKNERYSHELYEKLPPFFVGNRMQLEYTVQQMVKLQKVIAGDKMADKTDEILSWWDGKHKAPFNNDLYDVIRSPRKFAAETTIIQNVARAIAKDLGMRV